MTELIVTSTKDALVWMVLLVSGAAAFEMPGQECRKYMDAYVPGATNEELVMILKCDDAAVQQLVARLADDKYETRLRAERVLTAMGPDALPLLEKAREDADDPHTRFVLERVINNIGKPSVARERIFMTMLALRLLDPQSPEYNAVLNAHLSGKNYAVEKLALEELMRTRRAAAAPTVLAYMKKVSPGFSTLRPRRMAAIYRWLGDEALSGKDSGAIRSALLGEVGRVQGPAAPALVEALNRRAGREEVAAALAKLLARDEKAAEAIGRFVEKISGEKIAAKSLAAWLQSGKNFADTPDTKWNDAMAALVDSWRVACKAAERAETDCLNAPDTFLTACLDIEEFRAADLRAQWIEALFGNHNYTLQAKVIQFLALDGGVEINRIYFSASGKTAVDLDFLAGLTAGNIDIARLRKMLHEGCLLMTLKGEFDAKALRSSLDKYPGMCRLTHKQHDVYIVPGMSLCVLDDSTFLIGTGKGLPEVVKKIIDGSASVSGVAPGRLGAYRKNNGSKALLEALDRLSAENRPDPEVRFSAEGGIFRATLHRVEGHLAVPFAIKSVRVRLCEDDGLRARVKFECGSDTQAQALAAACKTIAKLVGEGKFGVKDKDSVIFNDILRDASIIAAGGTVTADVKIPAKVCAGIICFFSSNPVERYTSDRQEKEKENKINPFHGAPQKPGPIPGEGQKQPPVKQVPGGN